MAQAFVNLQSYARTYTREAVNTLVRVMRQPKTPPAARVAAAGILLDRGWGKAAQLVDVQGEIRQLVEVKLNVVQAAPARTIDVTPEPAAALPTPDGVVG